MSGLRQSLRSSLVLALVAVIGVALLAGTWQLTAERIAEQHRKAVLSALNQVLPAERYDNILQDDRIVVRATGFFKHKDPVIVYRARKQGRPAGLIMQLTTGEGYNGDIVLLVGIDPQGRVTGVRVSRHKETPGLGDAIDIRLSDWVLGFDGRSLDDPGIKNWEVQRDGGYFPQFTGATISPRAVVRAVRRALQYERRHRSELYTRPAEPEEKT